MKRHILSAIYAVWLCVASPACIRNATATAAFVAVLIGLAMERESLAWIVGGGVVFGSLTWSYLVSTMPRERRAPRPKE